MLSRYATVDIQLARTGTFDLIIGRPTTLPLRDFWPVWRDFLLIKRIRRFARHSDDSSFLTEHIARAFSRR
jgi:hypothetical protein